MSVNHNGRTEIEFKPIDVVRWEMIKVDDVHGSESGYDIVDNFGHKLEKVLDENQGIPTAVRIIIEGETPAHDDMLSDVERWTNEFRAATLEIGAGKVCVENYEP